MAQRVSRKRRISFSGKKLRRSDDTRAENRGIGAILWSACSGKSGVKKNITEYRIKERHAMIIKVYEDHPDLSLEHLCHLFGVSRSWYYEHIAKPEDDEEQ